MPVSIIPADVARLDAELPGSGVFFQRELEHIHPEVLREKLPVLNAFRYLPMDTSVPATAKTHTRRMFSHIGLADWISNYASDPNMVDVGGIEDTYKLKTLGVGYQFSDEDIAAAAALGRPLSREGAIAARRSTEEMMNRVAWDGDSDVGLYGVLSFPHFPRLILDNAIADGTPNDTVLAMLHSIPHSIREWTKDVAMPTRMLIASRVYNYIATTRASDASDTTILEYFLRTNRFITEVIPVHELEGRGPNGEDVVFCFEPNARVVGHVIPQTFTQLPAQRVNYAMKVPTKAKTGGVCSSYPLEAAVVIIPRPT